MDPISIGAGALGALETLTGGSAGPSGPATQGGNAVTVGGLTLGSKPPPWLLIALAVLALAVVWLALGK